jgi:pimeloyl-ACP methyl ester carboxylesterase
MKTATILIFLASLSLVLPTSTKANPPMDNDPPKLEDSKTILFITGAFVTNTGWDEWKTYFESKGYTTYAPPWPYKDASAAELRERKPDPELAKLRFDELVDYFADYAAKLPEKPILIGHSTGGLIAQLLLQRGLGVSAVAYHSVPPKGVLTSKFSFIKSVTPAFGPFKSADKTYLMSLKQWQYAFTNGMTPEEQQLTYDENTVPESRRVARGAIGKAAKIEFKQPHAPLLFVSGSEDHIIPASLNKKNFKKYQDENSIIVYQEFEGRNHFAMGQATWKEDADFILDWIANPRELDAELSTASTH